MGVPSAQQISMVVRCAACLAWNRVDASRASSGPTCGKCRSGIPLDRTLLLDDDSFGRTITAGDLPVLVDFYADWCGPCKMMAPIMDQLAKAYAGRVLVAKLDTDRSQRAAMPYHITGIPTTIVFHRGKEVGRQVGAVPRSVLENMLNVTLGQTGSSYMR